MGAGLDPVRGFPQGPVVELVRAGGHTEQRGVLAGGGGGGLAVLLLGVVVAGLDGGSHKARLRESLGHGGFGVGGVVGHCRFLSSEKNTAFPPERGGAASQAWKVRRLRRGSAPEGPQRSGGPAKRVAGRRCGPGMARPPRPVWGKRNNAAARQGGDTPAEGGGKRSAQGAQRPEAIGIGAVSEGAQRPEI